MTTPRPARRAATILTLITLLSGAPSAPAAGGEREAPFVGADLSHVPRLLSVGAEYRVGGQVLAPLDAFHLHGYRVVRLRLWHSPEEPWQGTSATLAFAQQAVAAGFDIMLDLHYSDTWADPAHQTKPAAWEGLEFSALVDSVYAYTNGVIRRFRDGGALPRYVQIGNEISPGFLWDTGRVGWEGSEWDTPEQWAQFTALLNAGVDAVRDSLPPESAPEIVIHFDNGAGNWGCRWFYDNLAAHGVDYDVIGLSFYPWWHGTLSELEANVTDLATRYGRPIQVVEAAYPWTLDWFDGTHNFVGDASQLHPGYPATPAGQESYLDSLLAVVSRIPQGLGAGLIYWEPAFLSVPGGPGNPYENLILFDFDGDALPGLGFAVPSGTGLPDAPHQETESRHGNAPNPFGPGTLISYSLTRAARADLRIYNTSGQLVRVLLEDHDQREGTHEVPWDGRDESGTPLATGVYVYSLEAGGESLRKSMVLIR